ncbi:bifunctional D-cysteine desulfhydrase/1-aminocyclopropane-1-carboxylate deaminase, mitochondrial-like, partial [Stylophora pistillata]
MNANNRAQLHKYEPPNWASSLNSIPKYFVKVRKLEFVLADALDKKCDTVITCGGLPSNHCRTTAVAAKQLGLNCYLLLRSSDQKTVNVGCKGNLLLSRMAGSNIILVPELKYKSGLKPMMEKVAEKLRQQGSAPYLVEVGGSSYTGLFGYLTAFQEMMDQNLLEDFDDIVLTVGSGGTAAGIAIANYLTGSKLKYSKIFLVEYVLEISSSTGVFIDPVYNIKAVRGMLAEMSNNPKRFQGNRILYIHTGGCFGLFDGRIDPLLTSSRSTQ